MAVPTDFSGLVAWHKADVLTLNDGDDVTSWTDSGSNGYHAVQYNTADLPIYKANIKNGKGVVRFSSALSQTLSMKAYTGAKAAWRNKGYGALFAVFKPTSATAKGDVMFIEDGTNGVGRFGFAVSETGYTGEFTLFGRRLDGDSAQFVHGGTITAGNWYIVSALVEWANANAHIRVNGDAVAETHSFQTAGNTSDTSSWSVEIGSSGGAAFFDGDVGECIWYNAQITESQAEELESYLNGRWAVYADDDVNVITSTATSTATATVTSTVEVTDWCVP